MTKYIQTKELADFTLPLIVKTIENWQYYLSFSANHYKYPFYDQVLIYAQRSDASACAPFDIWNKQLHRSVNKGAKGIALLREGRSGGYLEYVFDVSDTSDRYGRELKLWKYSNSLKEALIESLSAAFGEVEENEDIHIYVSSIIVNAVSDHYTDYFTAYLNTLSNSDTSEKTEILRDRFISGLHASIAFVAHSRMGLNNDASFKQSDFSFLTDFKTFEQINVLGSAVRDISEMFLRVVERSVKEGSRKIDTLAKDTILMQNEDNKKSINGGNNDADRVLSSGRSKLTEHSSPKENEDINREIRENERESLKESPNDPIFSADAHRGDEQVSITNRSRSESSGADHHGEIDEREPSAEQTDRPAGVGSLHERYQTYRRGNRDKRVDPQLSFFQTEDEQIELIEKAEAETSAFFISQDDIDEILIRGSSFEDGNLRIYAHYQNNPSKEDSVHFLKEEFGTGGYTNALSSYEKSYQDHSPKGIFISKGNIVSPDVKILIGWDKVDKRYRELISLGLFPSVEIKEKAADDFEELKAHEEYEEEIKLTEGSKQTETEKIEIGASVTIGDRNYLVDRIDDNKVSLQDVTFQNATGFPIFRIEPIDVVLANMINIDKPSTVKKAENFHITDNELGHGSLKTKYQYNTSAIKLLKKLEMENKNADTDEQTVLSKYVGWGGLQNVFDDNRSDFASEYRELKSLLSEEEYSAARESVLNAFYTPPLVINAMYVAISGMGFTKGNILEPSMGIGNFFGLLPEHMNSSKLYGVELDAISARIAKKLYPNADIRISGYEETNFPDNFFDVAIGNVPFGNYGVNDRAYNKHSFMIHDYFFAKTLDKVRPGGVIAFITSKGTMDKQSCEVRKYIAQRAELLGAIRLPNNAFSDAGTSVTSDILILKKRERVMEIDEDWIHLGLSEEGLSLNSYFVQNPHMILGRMSMQSTQYGREETTCVPLEGKNLSEQLAEVITYIGGTIEFEEPLSEEVDESIPADPNVRNFSFTVVEDEIYYRENSRMEKIDTSVTATHRIKGMISLRDCVRDLITYQLEDYPDNVIENEQRKLNDLYDEFSDKYGLISTRANSMAFSDDSSYYLLSSLESLDENGGLERKADMFTKRTINKRRVIDRVDTPIEALAVSIGEKACVDLSYMSSLLGERNEGEIADELTGIIFYNPISDHYETADEFLSGNVRSKLEILKYHNSIEPEKYLGHVKALTDIQPKDLDASEIDVRIGATWIPQEIIADFIYELLNTPRYLKRIIKPSYVPYTSMWNITGKNQDISSIHACVTYGTVRINAYKIIEESLNLKDVRIFDYETDENGNKKAVFNAKETTLAQQKQTQIKEAFKDWIFKDPMRRDSLVKLYNEKFNAIRSRVYDGSHLNLSGMSPEISLRPHQLNAIAHILYGGNTLLAHVVGAGKTYAMAAAAMESKRLSLTQKSLFVVPNHLTDQWGSEFLQLYPSANILVATRKDFETKKRKKFCARIATGDYDAVIIGHSQFEKIPMSVQRQKSMIENEIDDITEGINSLKRIRADRFTVKQLEKSRKTLKLRLDKLNDTSRKDDVITFEQLGVDRLFVDEAHSFKNLFLYTKMRNVAGISQSEALKSSDLYMKTRYIDEITDRRGIIFATGTPISNSMTELYTMQRYLQYDELKNKDLHHFDAWASTFGETVNAIELKPEGSGYRSKTRFAKFYNLPELMNMFRQVADVQTSDMLSLPVPKVSYHAEVISCSEHQKNMVLDLSERADRVRSKLVEPYCDNMLKITNDGRKLALDQRLINELLPDESSSKVNKCVNNCFTIWENCKDSKSTQLIFSDLSTPHYDEHFNVYEDAKKKLTQKGVPSEEIAFIHDANTEVKKVELFAKVRSGQVRILIGSTFKMGAGTNVQNRLTALHHLDIPWRPSDIEQREGRIIRQGNMNDEVEIFRYVTEGTFDAYSWQTIENKQKFIAQIMTSKSPVRSCEDIDETALSYAEIKMLATGNPHIKEKMDLDMQVARLKIIKASYLSQQYHLEDSVLKVIPMQIKDLNERKNGYIKDNDLYQTNKPLKKDDGKNDFQMVLQNISIVDKVKAGNMIIDFCKSLKDNTLQEIGTYLGFSLHIHYESFFKEFHLKLKNELSHDVLLGTDPIGNITRIGNVLDGIAEKQKLCEEKLYASEQQLISAKDELGKPFPEEEELRIKSARLIELDNLLSLNEQVSEDEIISEDIVCDELMDRKEYIQR